MGDIGEGSRMMRRSTLLLAATIGFGVLYLAAAAVLGSTPGPAESGQLVAAWFHSHGGHVRTWLWLLTLSLPLFAIFAAIVRSQLPAPHRDVFFFGAVAFTAETAVQGWLWAGMSWHAGQLDPSTARTLLDVASFWGPVLNSATLTMLAPVVIVALQGDRRVPRWVGAVGGIALVEQLIETVTVFGHRGFLAPGGPMNVYLGAGLVGVWLLCVGVTMARALAGDERRIA
jgi:hypothetical protein